MNSRASVGVRSLSLKNAHKRTKKTRTRRKNQKSENQNRNFNRRRIRRRKRNGAPRPVGQTQHASLARAFVGPSALQSTRGPAAAELWRYLLTTPYNFDDDDDENDENDDSDK